MTILIFRDIATDQDYDRLDFRDALPVIPAAGARVDLRDYTLLVTDSPLQYIYSHYEHDKIAVRIIVFVRQI